MHKTSFVTLIVLLTVAAMSFADEPSNKKDKQESVFQIVSTLIPLVATIDSLALAWYTIYTNKKTARINADLHPLTGQL